MLIKQLKVIHCNAICPKICLILNYQRRNPVNKIERKGREEKDSVIYWDQFRDSAKQREKIKNKIREGLFV